jgi:drug/metabolite transporter (DMT)-like permease
MALGAFFFSVMSVCVKLASRHLPSSHTVLARGVVTLVMSWAALRRQGLSPWGVDRKRLALRGFAGFVALNCYYYSLKHLSLADATVIQYSSPIFTAILAAIVLGERMGPREIACVAGSFVGVLLVAQPPFLFAGGTSYAPHALLVALAGSVTSSVAYVTVRKLRKTDDPAVIVFYFPLVAVPLSVAPVFADATWPTPFEWLLLAGIGVTTQVAQVLMTKSLHSEPAGRATAVSYLQVAFAYGWGLVVFGEVPNATSVLGAAVVAGSILVLAAKRTEPVAAAPSVEPSTNGEATLER